MMSVEWFLCLRILLFHLRSKEAAVEELNHSTELSDAREQLARLITERQDTDRVLNTIE